MERQREGSRLLEPYYTLGGKLVGFESKRSSEFISTRSLQSNLLAADVRAAKLLALGS